MALRPAPASQYPDFGAWTEMLSSISDKNARLSELVTRRWPKRTGTALLSELERERSRIARELHAGAGQPLAGIKLHLEALDGFTGEMSESARTTIGRLQTLADQALGQVRAVSHRLHPPEWQEMKLVEAMESLTDLSSLGTSLALTKDLPALTKEPSHDVKIQIYRCTQECLSNIIRHSGATQASISLAEKDGQLVLTVADNGRGFDAEARKSGSAGIGLRAIAENAASAGGTSRITSGPDGTRIDVSIPLDGE